MAKQLGAVCGSCGGQVQMVSAFCHLCGHGFTHSSPAVPAVPAVAGAGARTAARTAAAHRTVLQSLVAPTVAVPRASLLEAGEDLDGPPTAAMPSPEARLVPVSPRRLPQDPPAEDGTVFARLDDLVPLDAAPVAGPPPVDPLDGAPPGRAGGRRLVVVLAAAGAVVLVGAVAVVGAVTGHGGSAPSAHARTGSVASSSGTSWTASATASAPATSPDSRDAAGHATSYAAARMLDGDPATAWRMEHDGTGAVLTFTLDGEHPVRTLGLVNGYDKVDPASSADRYAQERRITRVTWIVDGHEHPQALKDGERGVQRLAVPAVTAHEVQLRIDATTKPGSPAFDKTAISDVVITG